MIILARGISRDRQEKLLSYDARWAFAAWSLERVHMNRDLGGWCNWYPQSSYGALGLQGARAALGCRLGGP